MVYMVYNPGFLKLKNQLEKPIIDFVYNSYEDEAHEAQLKNIMICVKKLKEKNPEDYKLVDFEWGGFVWSEQVAEVVVDLVRDFILKETYAGYKLTALGKKLFKENSLEEKSLVEKLKEP